MRTGFPKKTRLNERVEGGGGDFAHILYNMVPTQKTIEKRREEMVQKINKQLVSRESQAMCVIRASYVKKNEIDEKGVGILGYSKGLSVFCSFSPFASCHSERVRSLGLGILWLNFISVFRLVCVRDFGGGVE